MLDISSDFLLDSIALSVKVVLILSIVSHIVCIALIDASIAFWLEVSIIAVESKVLKIGLLLFIARESLFAESSLIRSLFLAISKFQIKTTKLLLKYSTFLINKVNFSFSFSSVELANLSLNSTIFQSINSL